MGIYTKNHIDAVKDLYFRHSHNLREAARKSGLRQQFIDLKKIADANERAAARAAMRAEHPAADPDWNGGDRGVWGNLNTGQWAVLCSLITHGTDTKPDAILPAEDCGGDWHSFPSIERIAFEAHMTEKQARVVLRELESDELGNLIQDVGESEYKTRIYAIQRKYTRELIGDTLWLAFAEIEEELARKSLGRATDELTRATRIKILAAKQDAVRKIKADLGIAADEAPAAAPVAQPAPVEQDEAAPAAKPATVEFTAADGRSGQITKGASVRLEHIATTKGTDSPEYNRAVTDAFAKAA